MGRMTQTEIRAAPVFLKKCGKCGEIKPSTDFHIWTRKADGRDTYCILCRKSMKAATYKAKVTLKAGATA